MPLILDDSRRVPKFLSSLGAEVKQGPSPYGKNLLPISLQKLRARPNTSMLQGMMQLPALLDATLLQS